MLDFRLKAMVIDASSESASHVRSVLAHVKIDVVEWARTGVGWVQPWQNAKVDLVIVDYVLPKKDGLFVVQKIAEVDPACGIIFTHSFQGWVANEIEVSAFQFGAGACFQRPFSDKRFMVIAEKLAHQTSKKRAPTKVKMHGAP